jgi:hypothetical protein
MLYHSPIFLDEGVIEIVRNAFDLPFVGTCNTLSWKIGIFAMQKLINHLMHMDTYHTNFGLRNQSIAHRFVRVWKLKNIAEINQEILSIIHNLQIEPIRKILDRGLDTVPIMDRLLAGKVRKISSHISMPSLTFLTVDMN